MTDEQIHRHSKAIICLVYLYCYRLSAKEAKPLNPTELPVKGILLLVEWAEGIHQGGCPRAELTIKDDGEALVFLPEYDVIPGNLPDQIFANLDSSAGCLAAFLVIDNVNGQYYTDSLEAALTCFNARNGISLEIQFFSRDQIPDESSAGILLKLPGNIKPIKIISVSKQHQPQLKYWAVVK